MAKVTSKLQVTLPKRIAEAHGIAPGDEIEFESAGDVIRIVPGRRKLHSKVSLEERLRLFDAATRDLKRRAAALHVPEGPPEDRGWRRDELYERGKPR